MNKGFIHIYCGNGKGKTTAAAGLAIRCAGAGGKVFFCQFLKDGSSGEINVLKKIEGIEVMENCKNVKFIKNMTEKEKKEAAEFYKMRFESINERVTKNEFDLLILDEIINTVNAGFISLERLIFFLENKPFSLEVVLTGRNPDKSLVDTADYVSEITKVKHPFDKGVPARKMIEK